jgi:hypothetical protein
MSIYIRKKSLELTPLNILNNSGKFMLYQAPNSILDGWRRCRTVIKGTGIDHAVVFQMNEKGIDLRHK